MTQLRTPLANSIFRFRAVRAWATLVLGLAFFASPAFAQQTGDITGRVTDAAGAGISGVSIEASSNVLPQARTATSAANGQYLFRLLPPGNYELKFSFSDGSTSTRTAAVLLQQRTAVDIATGEGAEMEEIVSTGSAMLADTGQGALKNTINADTVDALPVGQEYRDLMKLIPGVLYTENEIRGPSAGGSGQDNSYQFDGVDVSLPLFGVLASEPSTHDIAQVSVVRGGSKAVGFHRAPGFKMNTVSKSGTDEFHGEVSYQVQTGGMTGDLDTGDSPESFDEDRSWTTVSLGGPIIRDRLYFYTSYYRPDFNRSNTANAYGAVGDFDDVRDEYFAKLTFAPTDNILLDGSYRTSDHDVSNDSIGPFEAATASVGTAATQDILILEGSWIVSDATSVNFKYTDFENLNADRPDTEFNFQVTEGDSLNIASLDQQGYFNVPQPITGEDAYNAFIQPLIDQYGYSDAGVQTGGGAVGGYFRYNNQDFFRESFEISMDHLIYADNSTHDIHIGYQTMEVSEDLNRQSNGWGSISAPGGLTLATDGVTPIFYQATVSQQSLLASSGGTQIPSIFSTSELQSLEINDTIEMGDWTFNVGVMFSNDVLYGQGLGVNSSNPITGLEPSPGTKYKMYEVDWGDMLQPRLGANWDFSDTASMYVNFARYNPSASSLARAASWDRNLRRDIYVRWDANGNFIESQAVGASSGKVFVENMDPRVTNEIVLGFVKDMDDGLTLRAHLRHNKSYNFWEDTWNWGRLPGNWGAPDNITPEPHIPDAYFAAVRDEIGGSSFVIAELEGSFTKLYEASIEAEWNRDNWFLSGSYTLSHYFGNFDQDVTTTANDQATFIGSSNLADAAGRNLWDFKKGNLGGDRRHKLKLYGFYQFDWSGRAGAFLVGQSGEPWEAWDSNVYRDLTSSTSDTIRFAETAGKRTTDSHYQLDLNYTHNFNMFGDSNLQLRADFYNVTDNQTGYNIQRKVNDAGFGDPDDYFKPRRFQIAVKYQF
jgi:hypothetical protein